MKKPTGVLFVFLLLLALPTIQSQSSTDTTTCPIDFSYVLRVPFNYSSCKNFQVPPKTPGTDVTEIPCCQTLTSVLGIGLAQFLKDTSFFLLPNTNTSITCFQSFQSNITSLSLPSDVVSYCFDPTEYVTSSNFCAHIKSSQDWLSKLNNTTALETLDTECKPDLTNRTQCDACTAAGTIVLQNLYLQDGGNFSHYCLCWGSIVLYAAGMINEFGPESNGSVSCLFDLSMNAQVLSQFDSPKKSFTSLVIVIVSVTAGVLTILISYLVWKKRLAKSREDSKIIRKFNSGDGGNDTELPLFSMRSMLVATSNFSEANKLGEGGFGPVYKGILAENQEVAVKRLSKKSGQGQQEFINEVKLIAKLQHTNLVRLLGCCIEEEEMILVYEYMVNRSLDKFLFDSSENIKLDWGKRFKIIEGIAQGVLYIHKYSRLKIIHRDLKASNVLLDEDMNPKISDFGMAKIFEKNQTEANTNRVVGTYGYMSPEYASYGHFSEKSDVFSFGVLLLEIISGKRNAAFYRFEHPLTLAGWAWQLWTEGGGMKVINDCVRKECPPDEALRCMHVAFLCVQEDPTDRPTMATAIHMLLHETASSLPPCKEPAFLAHSNSSQQRSFPSSIKFSNNAITTSILEGR